MYRKMLLAAGVAVFFAAPALAATAPRNYDCTKPGNANKAACKAKAAPAAAKPAPAPKPAPKPATVAAKPAPAPKPATVAAKPAPAPKPATVAAKPAPAPKPATVAAKPAAPRNYDCTKAGNANKTVCKAAAKPAPTTGRCRNDKGQYAKCGTPGTHPA